MKAIPPMARTTSFDKILSLRGRPPAHIGLRDHGVHGRGLYQLALPGELVGGMGLVLVTGTEAHAGMP